MLQILTEVISFLLVWNQQTAKQTKQKGKGGNAVTPTDRKKQMTL